MAKKCVEVKTLHNYSLEKLIKIEKTLEGDYSKSLLRAVIMRYQGVHTTTIAQTIGKSIASVTIYINRWNEFGLDATIDFRGGSVGTFTDEMKEDLKRVVLNADPRAYGFEATNWNTHMLSKYIKDKYKKEYTAEWIRVILHQLGFSYKRGVYKPSKANPWEQEKFKKNVYPSG